LFLLASLACLGAWGSMHWKPNWILQLDRRLVERELADVRAAVSLAGEGALTPEDRIQRLEPVFHDHKDVQNGDRIFPAWVQIGEGLIRDDLALGRRSQAAKVMERLLEHQPRRLDLRLRMADVLSQPGEGQDLEGAQAQVDWVLNFFPEWQAAREAQLELYGRARDWKAFAESVTQVLANPAPLDLDSIDALRGVSTVHWETNGNGDWETTGRIPEAAEAAEAAAGGGLGRVPWPPWLTALVLRNPAAEPLLREQGLAWPTQPKRADSQ